MDLEKEEVTPPIRNSSFYFGTFGSLSILCLSSSIKIVCWIFRHSVPVLVLWIHFYITNWTMVLVLIFLPYIFCLSRVLWNLAFSKNLHLLWLLCGWRISELTASWIELMIAMGIWYDVVVPPSFHFDIELFNIGLSRHFWFSKQNLHLQKLVCGWQISELTQNAIILLSYHKFIWN